MPGRAWWFPRRVLTSPRVVGAPSLLADGSVLVRVDGMVCRLCARRTEAAFRALPGVEAASADLEGGMVRVRCAGMTAPHGGDLQHALEGAVIGMSARRWLERWAHRRQRREGER